MECANPNHSHYFHFSASSGTIITHLSSTKYSLLLILLVLQHQINMPAEIERLMVIIRVGR